MTTINGDDESKTNDDEAPLTEDYPKRTIDHTNAKKNRQ